MSCYVWSPSLNELDKYRGFFPSYVDDHFDLRMDSSCDAEENGNVDITKIRSEEERETEGTNSENASSSGGSGDGVRCRIEGRKRAVRKSKSPHRSANKNDPRFRGVTFCVQTKLCSEKRHRSQLLIRSCYSVRKNRPLENKNQDGSRSTACRARRKTTSTSSTSESEPELVRAGSAVVTRRIAVPSAGITAFGGKQCASCSTRRTPLWRDAEDGTPLCNACGIRYKKYRIRCISCWLIPKKDGKSCHVCPRCGDVLRIIILKRSYVS